VSKIEIPVNLRSFDIAKPSSLDLDVPITFFGRIADLATDVLSFAITIGPDDKKIGGPS